MWYMIFSRPGGWIYFSLNSLLCELLFFFFLLLSKFHAPLKWTTKSNFIFSQDLHFYQIRWYKEMIILVFFCNVYSVIKIYFSFQDEFSISLKGISEDDSDFPDGFWFLLFDWLMSSASCFWRNLYLCHVLKHHNMLETNQCIYLLLLGI